MLKKDVCEKNIMKSIGAKTKPSPKCEDAKCGPHGMCYEGQCMCIQGLSILDFKTNKCVEIKDQTPLACAAETQGNVVKSKKDLFKANSCLNGCSGNGCCVKGKC